MSRPRTLLFGTMATAGIVAAALLAALPAGAVLYGEVNCDGRINSIDAALVLQLDAGLVPSLPCEFRADVNADGQVNAVDAVLILQFIAAVIPELGPTPVPTQPASTPPAFDFSITASGPAMMPEGLVSFTTSASVSLQVVQGEPVFVTLTETSEPPGPDAAYILPGTGFVNGCTPRCTLGIHLGFPSGARVGSYSITITSTSGAVEHSTKLAVTVISLATPGP